MRINSLVGVRHFGLASAAVLAVGFGAVGTAGAASYSPSHRGWSASSSPTASVADDTLTITGTNASDNISIALANGDPNTLTVDLDNDGTVDQHFDRNTFSAIAVFLRRGDDQSAVLGTSPDETLIVDGGSGDDTITTGSGNDLIFAGSGDDVVTGGIGRDTAFLGSGRDSFVWNPGDGSDFVSGDSGYDTLVFNGAPGAEQMSLSANGPLSVFLRQPGNVRMDMDGIQELDLTPLAGQDTIAVNDLSGTDITKADIDLAVAGKGDAAADSVTVNGTDNADRVHVDAEHGRVDVEGLRAETRITGSEPANDHLQVNTLSGRDKIRVDDGVSTRIGVDTDLGTI
jgi:hypothetical protein